MRLVCPNCAAQYEVEDHVIPDNGRDVQCSNCGHTWYQRSPNRPVSKPRPEPAPIAPEPEPAKEPEDDFEDADAAQPELQRKPLDGGITDILREEAEREAAEREAERATGLETQPDLGLDNRTDETPPNVRERMARLRELDEELDSTAIAAAPVAGSRKEMLPDIEEINSTLSPDEDEVPSEEEAAAQEETRRSGFRRGFGLVVLIFAVMALVYVFAPKIVEMNPQSEPALTAYVDWINGLRIKLDGLLGGAADSLKGKKDGLNGG